MNITVKLGAALAAYKPAHESRNTFSLTLAAAGTTADVLSILSIPANQPVMLIVNDELIAPEARATHLLKDDDRVSVLTPIHAG